MLKLVKPLGISFLMLATAHAQSVIDVDVLSAVVKDQKIAGAQVIVQKNGAQSAVGTTDAEGKVKLNAEFADNDKDVLLIIKKPGFSDLVAKCPCTGMTYALSPVMEKKLDGLRVVLNWGAKPTDLDSHIAYPGSHIYFEHKVGTAGNLDVDDIDSYGPETVTIAKKKFGDRYVYAVHSYSDRQNPAAGNLAASQAKVFVYIGQSLIRTYYVPRNLPGNLWTVFSIDGNGEFHDINTIASVNENWHQPFVAQVGRSTAAGTAVAASTTTATPAPVSATTAQTNSVAVAAPSEEAKRLNRKGEEAFHAKDLNTAIDLFKQAIELAPNFGQAYSNLGLSYQKADRVAEALWANRKAIALANGSNANVTRANSYYNIARIYEAAEQFDDALQQYQLANAERPQKVYQDAMTRMQGKLQP